MTKKQIIDLWNSLDDNVLRGIYDDFEGKALAHMYD